MLGAIAPPGKGATWDMGHLGHGAEGGRGGPMGERQSLAVAANGLFMTASNSWRGREPCVIHRISADSAKVAFTGFAT